MLLLYLLIFCSAASSEQLRREKRAWIIDSFSIVEEHPGPFPYELGNIDIERKYRVHFGLYGAGVDEEPKGVLSIDKESGIVYVHKAVDYEEIQVLKLRFEALKEDLSLDTQLGVEVTIQDINDNPPRFQRDLYELTVREEEAQGSSLLSVLAHDRDKRGTPASTFHYEIKSVSPTPPDAEFFINDVGRISFKGCLDYEASDSYTVLVEAIDHGEVVQLSSSTTVLIHIQDGNNHLPTISGKTGSGNVTEVETGSSPLRLHTTDRDSKNSPAWRATYSISGDKGGHFMIQTERDTNDGILTVVKALDFEEGAVRELSISVENEVPYFSCKVTERTSSGLWKVETTRGGRTSSARTVSESQSVTVIIQVEDANDAPMFTVAVTEVVVEENAAIGTDVGGVTAVDPDNSHAKDFVYMIADDPDGWVNVDPHTGNITTAKMLDRESPHANNGTYTVILHAVDNGNPPMTGTATLLIHVKDQNDNLPQLTVNHVDMCVSEGPTTSTITAVDLDSEPFGGPFAFELLGDVMGKWKLDPLHGYTVNLVRDSSVFAGPHTVELKISDLQGQSGIYNLSVTVCDCSVTPNCHIRRTTGSNVSYGADRAVMVVFAALLLLLCFLLLAMFISCKREFSIMQIDNTCGETLLSSNTENPGTDCKVPFITGEENNEQKHQSHWQKGGKGKHRTHVLINVNDQSSQHVTDTRNQYFYYVNGNSMKQVHDQSSMDVTGNQYFHVLNGNSVKQRTSTVVDYDYHHYHQVEDGKRTQSLHNLDTRYGYISDRSFISFLHQRLLSVKATEIDLGDDKPHIYADEGNSFDTISDLEDIIPEDHFTLSELDDLDPKFGELAAICNTTACKPDRICL